MKHANKNNARANAQRLERMNAEHAARAAYERTLPHNETRETPHAVHVRYGTFIGTVDSIVIGVLRHTFSMLQENMTRHDETQKDTPHSNGKGICAYDKFRDLYNAAVSIAMTHSARAAAYNARAAAQRVYDTMPWFSVEPADRLTRANVWAVDKARRAAYTAECERARLECDAPLMVTVETSYTNDAYDIFTAAYSAAIECGLMTIHGNVYAAADKCTKQQYRAIARAVNAYTNTWKRGTRHAANVSSDDIMNTRRAAEVATENAAYDETERAPRMTAHVATDDAPRSYMAIEDRDYIERGKEYVRRHSSNERVYETLCILISGGEQKTIARKYGVSHTAAYKYAEQARRLWREYMALCEHDDMPTPPRAIKRTPWVWLESVMYDAIMK